MTIKQIDDDKASWAADQFIDYFQNFTNLEEYLRHVKKSVVTKSSILDDPKAVSYTHLTLPTKRSV